MTHYYARSIGSIIGPPTELIQARNPSSTVCLTLIIVDNSEIRLYCMLSMHSIYGDIHKLHQDTRRWRTSPLVLNSQYVAYFIDEEHLVEISDVMLAVT